MNTWNTNKFQSTYHIKPLDKILLSSSTAATSSSSRLFLADHNYSNNQSNLPLNIINDNDFNNNNNVNESSSTISTCTVSTKNKACMLNSHINSFNPTELLSKKWILSLMIFFVSTLALHLPSVLASTGGGGIDSIITTIGSSLSRFGSSSSSSVATDLTTLDLSDNSNGGFIQSFLIIFISEIGDKTFFIAGLLAAKYGRLLSFSGSISALAIMTIISTVLGQIFHAIPSSITQGVPYDDYIAIIAFTYFGIKTLYDANQLQDGKSSGIDEERAEAEEVVSELTSTVANDNRNNTIALFIQIFSLVFAAEIGKLTTLL
jgi:putative Ca2+/H+ antiporter (TMEM165/GDT1 family)